MSQSQKGSKNMKKKLLFLIPFLALLWTISRHTNIYTLPLYDGDGHTHYKQLIDMWQGIKQLNPFKLFSFNLNYGTPYFFAALLFSLPGQIFHNDALFILGPRLVAALGGLGTVFLSYKILKHQTTHNAALTFAGLLCLMPGFWLMTRQFRPDWVLAFAITAFVYFLLKDKGEFGPSFWKGVLCYGIAIATKTEAITSSPILIAYCFHKVLYDPFLHLKTHLTDALKRFLKALSLLIGVFVLINPHALHPVGLYGIIRRFKLEVLLVTPGSPLRHLSFSERLALISDYLVASPLLIAAFVVGAWSLYSLWSQKKKPELFSVILGSFPCYIFLLIVSKKCNWNFLISAIPLLPLFVVTVFNRATRELQILILSFCVIAGLYTLSPWVENIFIPDFEVMNRPYKENNAFVIPLLKPYQNKLHYIGVSNTVVVDYGDFGLTFPQVRIITGPLDTWHINSSAHEKYWHGLRETQKKFGLSHVSIKPYYPKQALIIAKKHPSSEPNMWQNLLSDKTDYHYLGENQNVYVFVHKKLL